MALSLVLILTVCLSVHSVSLEKKQTLPHHHQQWQLVRDAAADDTVTLTFALKQQNLEQLDKMFWAVSTPHSSLYGQHLTLNEVMDLVRPSFTTLKSVISWLAEHGVKECETVQTQDFLTCHMSVDIAEVMLQTKFSYYKHTEQSITILRASQEYSVAESVAEHLDFIGGLHRVPNTARIHKQNVKEVDSFRYGVHPDTLRKRYNISEHVGTNTDNVQGTAQFLNQHFSPTDLKEFMYFFGKSFPHLKEVTTVVGPNKGKAGLEANLDVQYMMSIGANISTTFWSTAHLHEKQEPFLQWLLDISNTSQVPDLFSVSYGDHERTLSTEYMERVNTEFKKAGLRGISILFASGDDGAGCHYFNDTSFTFEPDFPASSPYVTTVGGTEFTSIFSDVDEKANDISGGGFSNVFNMPDYQVDTVQAYLNTTKLPDASLFNPKMRAYPDVSAMSDDFWIIISRLLMNVAGTSAATPTVAGMIALANDARMNAGKPALGFLNPFIYQNPQIFYDITIGNNQACWLEDLEGYNVAKGWDPVTGFGSPDYNRLVAAALAV